MDTWTRCLTSFLHHKAPFSQSLSQDLYKRFSYLLASPPVHGPRLGGRSPDHFLGSENSHFCQKFPSLRPKGNVHQDQGDQQEDGEGQVR